MRSTASHANALGFRVKCDHCDKEATVHEWTKKAGHKVEKHLCEECARNHGVAIQPQQQISQLLTQLISNTKLPPAAPGVATPGGPLKHAPQATACATCGTTYAQFRHSGLLGCPACYSSFEAQLSPLLQRAHEGGAHHAGKAPPSAPTSSSSTSSAPLLPRVHGPPVPQSPVPATSAADLQLLQAQQALQRARAEKVSRLRAELSQAVAAEQYERAASLRDQLNALESGPSRQHAPGKSGELKTGQEGHAADGGSGGS